MSGATNLGALTVKPVILSLGADETNDCGKQLGPTMH